MESLTMSPNLLLGIDVIDRQHGRFYDLMNELIAADPGVCRNEAIADTIENLARYVMEHFRTEEELMERCGYPDLAAHQLQHARFAAQVEDFSRKFAAGRIGLDLEILGCLVTWFTDHVRCEDPRYVAHLKASGLP